MRCDMSFPPNNYGHKCLKIYPKICLRIILTRSSATAEGPRDVPCQLKPCEMSHKCPRNCIWYVLQQANITHTHTHPFNGPFSGTTQVSRYQKGKTNLDFTEARDSEWQWHPLCKFAPRSSQITTPVPHHSVFTGRMPIPAAQPTASKHWRHNRRISKR